MVYKSSRVRKRVSALRRGPDGSAFQNCERCGVSVAIALADIHDCGDARKKVCKNVKTQPGNTVNVKKLRLQDQPRSAFRVFIEEFMKSFDDGNRVEIDKRGFETWKNMSAKERQPFVLEADKINSAYEKLLHKEESQMLRVDDEADSAEVGKYAENYEEDYACLESGGFAFLSESHWSVESCRFGQCGSER